MLSFAETIADAKKRAEADRDDLLKTFSFVPDEKLTWSPAESARTPIWLVAHCGAAGQAFATFLRGEVPAMPSDPAEIAEMIRNTGRDVTSREEAIRMVEDASRAIQAAFDTVTEDRMGSMSQTPFGPMPFTIWIQAATTHMSGHARQIDYLQTIWGDLQDHM